MMMERLEQLNFQEVLRCHLENVRLYSRGSIILPIIRESTPSGGIAVHLGDRLSINTIQRIDSLNVLSEDDFDLFFNVVDPFSPNYKKIDTAFIRGIPVHPSRYFWNANKFFPIENEGVSVLHKVLLAALALRISNWSLATVMIEVQNKVLKVENLDEYARQDDASPDFRSGTGARTKVMDQIKRWMTSAKMIVINKEDDYERTMYSATGVKEATDFFWEYLSAVTGMPQSAIKGQAQGTISSADVDARRYVEKIRTEQQFKTLKPIIMGVVRLLKFEQKSKFGRTFGLAADDIQFELEFNQIWRPDANEESTIKLRDTQRGQIDIATGVRASDQVRRDNYPELEDEPLPEIPEQPEPAQLLNQQAMQKLLFE